MIIMIITRFMIMILWTEKWGGNKVPIYLIEYGNFIIVMMSSFEDLCIDEQAELTVER